MQVTFFWNGNRSGYFNESLETYVEIPSDTVPFNEIPEMKAREITEAGKEALLSGKYQMVRINYANPGEYQNVYGQLAFPNPFDPQAGCEQQIAPGGFGSFRFCFCLCGTRLASSSRPPPALDV
jgi:hypothetical protein